MSYFYLDLGERIIVVPVHKLFFMIPFGPIRLQRRYFQLLASLQGDFFVVAMDYRLS